MNARLLLATAALVLAAGCAKIFGVDDPGIPSDGGVGQPCDPGNSGNQTLCGSGNVCLTNSNTCAMQCMTDADCTDGQTCQNASIITSPGMTMGVAVNACQAPGTGGCNGGGCGCGGGSCGGSGSGGGSGGSSGGGEASAPLAPMPKPRGEVACVVGSNNKVYVFGGFDSSHQPTPDVQIYDPASNTWSSGTGLLTPRFAAGVGYGQQPGIFFLMGGFVASGMATGDTEEFDAFNSPGGTWAPMTSMPTPVGGAAVAGMGQIIVAGGSTSVTSPPIATAQVFQSGGQWGNQSLSPMPMPRNFAASVNAAGGLLVMGGFDGTGMASDVVQRFGGSSWSTVMPMPKPRGKASAAVGPNGLVYVVGGANGGAVDDLTSYDANQNVWMPLNPMHMPRAGVCAAWVPMTTQSGGRLYAIGGDDGAMGTGSVYSFVEAYDPNSGLWSQ